MYLTRWKRKGRPEMELEPIPLTVSILFILLVHLTIRRSRHRPPITACARFRRRLGMSNKGQRIIRRAVFIINSGKGKSWSQAMKLAAQADQETREKKTNC
jgi:hypothetical protein